MTLSARYDLPILAGFADKVQLAALSVLSATVGKTPFADKESDKTIDFIGYSACCVLVGKAGKRKCGGIFL